MLLALASGSDSKKQYVSRRVSKIGLFPARRRSVSHLLRRGIQPPTGAIVRVAVCLVVAPADTGASSANVTRLHGRCELDPPLLRPETGTLLTYNQPRLTCWLLPSLTRTLGTRDSVSTATAESFLYALTLPTVCAARWVPTAASATADGPRQSPSPLVLLASLLRSSPSSSSRWRRSRWRRWPRGDEERSRLEGPDERGLHALRSRAFWRHVDYQCPTGLPHLSYVQRGRSLRR